MDRIQNACKGAQVRFRDLDNGNLLDVEGEECNESAVIRGMAGL